MSAYAITLELPPSLYDHFKRRAEARRRSVEAELLEVVRSAAGENEEQLPRELAEELSRLEAQDDETLWRTARSHLPREAGARLEALNTKHKNEGLTADEKDDLSRHLYQYDRYMLLRAHAARILREGGHDISAPPSKTTCGWPAPTAIFTRATGSLQ